MLPRRNYFLASVHIEFIMFKGKQEVYEINLFCQDQSSLELIVVPEAIKNDTSTLDALGFTWNRNLNRYAMNFLKVDQFYSVFQIHHPDSGI